MRMDEITNQPLEKCLLWLAYQSDRVQLEDLLYKEQMKKIK